MPGQRNPRRALPVECRLAAVGSAILIGLACAGTATPPRSTVDPVADIPLASGAGHPVPGLDLPVSELGTQRLFRVRYQGPKGEGRLRLVLRLAGEDDFSVVTSDMLGRALWSLSLAGTDLVLMDHRAETFCRSESEVTLPEVALAPLPLHSLPGVLLGYLPPPEGSEVKWRDVETVEIVDGPGRQWVAKRVDGALKAWTLWLDGEPTLWWTPQPGGGILSHRRGVQFRWRQVVVEPLDSQLQGLDPPNGYRETSCHEPALQELREDQSPSRGPGSAD